ncbi:hypothetical protein TRFO_29187 [Tritrichomonas foetus]|uniref:Kinetochore protein SPC25 n=1 Tax=Tritrichomonas foetus TaxID=1144522 RepID=A0A1J4JWK8_9EUKA|nr:hypothetical protein TRFO_29187 [Tritrichomonas foetus]|eukprot:OHT03387.1 hypothetical protein TRFO_29187 [Tritrichomonas foetus]
MHLFIFRQKSNKVEEFFLYICIIKKLKYVRLINMNDEIKTNVDDLIKLLDDKQREFDNWIDEQMNNLKNQAQKQTQANQKFDAQMKQLKEKQISIKQDIQKANNSAKQCHIKEKQMIDQKEKLEEEIQIIPKDFDFYKYNIMVLETKANRIKNSHAQNFEAIQKMKCVLEAYETLFGVSFHIEKGSTTIEFMNPKATIKLSCEKQYSFIEIPKELKSSQKQIIDKFNNDKNLFNFLFSIRSHLC